MDWTYRVPKLRDWVTFYGDAFADDQISPIAYWDRSAIRGGLFFSHVPRIPKLDLRVSKVSIPICPREARSATAFSTSIPDTSMATRTRANYWPVGLAVKGRVHRAGQTIGLAPAIGYSLTIDIKR